MQQSSIALLLAGLLVTTASAQEVDMVEAKALYIQECSKCHGQINPQADTAKRKSFAPAAPIKVAYRPIPSSDGPLLAFSFPYGPNLQGIYGQPAGSIPGYEYSKAFMKTLQGMHWISETLDGYLADTQAWAKGIRMFYRQPDGEIRRKIIAYLKANS